MTTFPLEGPRPTEGKLRIENADCPALKWIHRLICRWVDRQIGKMTGMWING